MADFCKQCSIEIFGEDYQDLAYDRGSKLPTPPVTENEGRVRVEGWVELCEGCGPTLVNDEGECIYPLCKVHGKSEES